MGDEWCLSIEPFSRSPPPPPRPVFGGSIDPPPPPRQVKPDMPCQSVQTEGGERGGALTNQYPQPPDLRSAPPSPHPQSLPLPPRIAQRPEPRLRSPSAPGPPRGPARRRTSDAPRTRCPEAAAAPQRTPTAGAGGSPPGPYRTPPEDRPRVVRGVGDERMRACTASAVGADRSTQCPLHNKGWLRALSRDEGGGV